MSTAKTLLVIEPSVHLKAQAKSVGDVVRAAITLSMGRDIVLNVSDPSVTLDSLGVDSLDCIEIAMDIERAYDDVIDLNGKEGEWVTVADVIASTERALVGVVPT